MAKANGSVSPAFPALMDMSKFMPDMSAFKMPNMNMGMGMPSFGFDMGAMMQVQRRAAEAMTEMSQKAMSATQALMQRQGEMMRESMQESAALVSEVMSTASPEQKMARQSELTKAAFEKCVANSRELVEMVTQSNRETAEMVTSHVTQTMEEIRNACAGKQQ